MATPLMRFNGPCYDRFGVNVRRPQGTGAHVAGTDDAARAGQIAMLDLALVNDGDGLGFMQDWLGHANTQKTIIYAVLTARAGCAKGVHAAAELV